MLMGWCGGGAGVQCVEVLGRWCWCTCAACRGGAGVQCVEMVQYIFCACAEARVHLILMKFFAVTLLCSVIALGAANLQGRYPSNAVLLDEGGLYYELHWNYVSSTETISFAVNVSTTGWVGFGLSPTGSMTGSDVVIGWVSDEGKGYFHVSWKKYKLKCSYVYVRYS